MPLILCMWLTIVSAQVNLAQTVASNENLEEQSINADTDVNEITMLNGLDFALVRFVFLVYTYGRLTISA